MIQPDKIKHLQGGAAIALALLAASALASLIGWWAAVGAGSLGAGVGIELYQRWRGEGAANWPDAIASALPGLVLAGGLLVAGI